MTPGDVVLTPVPQADGKVKIRPATLLCQLPPFGDWLVCGVSTQLHQEVVGFDEVINITDADFAGSGLRAASLVRLGFLSVLPAAKIVGSLGAIAPERRAKLVQNLSDYLLR